MSQQTLWTDAQFHEELGNLTAIAEQFWTVCTILVVQAIQHFHASSLDVSRVEALYRELEEQAAGSALAAYSGILRRTTPISGIGGEERWKGAGNAKKFENSSEQWETVIAQVREHGLKYFTPMEEKKRTAANSTRTAPKQTKAKTNLRVSDKLSDAVRNKAQVAMDKLENMPEETQLQLLEQMASGTVGTDGQSVFVDPGIPTELHPQVQEYLGLVKKQADKDLESARNGIAAAIGKVRRYVESHVESVKEAAKDDAKQSEAA